MDMLGNVPDGIPKPNCVILVLMDGIGEALLEVLDALWVQEGEPGSKIVQLLAESSFAVVEVYPILQLMPGLLLDSCKGCCIFIPNQYLQVYPSIGPLLIVHHQVHGTLGLHGLGTAIMVLPAVVVFRWMASLAHGAV